MNIGIVARTALRAVQSDSIENKILVSKKIIRDLEDHPNEASFRLCRDLRAVLKSVAKDSEASAERISDAGSLLSRVQKLDPRNQKPEPVRLDRDETIKPKAPICDGYEHGFIDPVASLFRVITQYGSTQPKWTPLENENLLQVALGDVPLGTYSVVQLWLTLAYDFKNRLKCVTSAVLPQSHWITAAICEYVNTRQIHVPTPNCFENVLEELAFLA